LHELITPPPRQLPIPSHVSYVVSMPPLQAVAEHDTELRASVHAPVPAVQAPVAPQGGLMLHAEPQQTPLLPQAPDAH
jgi:hypothetical protein